MIRRDERACVRPRARRRRKTGGRHAAGGREATKRGRTRERTYETSPHSRAHRERARLKTLERQRDVARGRAYSAARARFSRGGDFLQGKPAVAVGGRRSL